jgi:uncharacterized protein
MDKKIEKSISKLEAAVQKMFAGDASGHSIDHLRRTVAYAVDIQKVEGGDLAVVAVAAFVHDIHRIMQTKMGRYVDPHESLPKVREIISALGLTPAQIDHICYAVEHHEEGREGVKVDDIETQILQDADVLDGLGAIGLTRIIEHNIAQKIPMYVPNVPLYRNDFRSNTYDISVIHHLNNVYLGIGDRLNTQTAREIAKPKEAFLRGFIDLFMAEWR